MHLDSSIQFLHKSWPAYYFQSHFDISFPLLTADNVGFDSINDSVGFTTDLTCQTYVPMVVECSKPGDEDMQNLLLIITASARAHRYASTHLEETHKLLKHVHMDSFFFIWINSLEY